MDLECFNAVKEAPRRSLPDPFVWLRARGELGRRRPRAEKGSSKAPHVTQAKALADSPASSKAGSRNICGATSHSVA